MIRRAMIRRAEIRRAETTNLRQPLGRAGITGHTRSRRAESLYSTIARYRFTLAAVIGLTVFAVLSDSYWQVLTSQWCNWLGFSATNLLDLQWYRLLSSLPLTAGGWKFPASLLMLGACVGIAEHRYGTVATIKLFLTSHVTVLLVLSVALLVLERGVDSPSVLALVKGRDIGPSAGYYGCLGAILMLLAGFPRGTSFVFVLSILLVRLMVSVSDLPDAANVVSADAAHLFALPLGGLLAWCGYVRPLPLRVQGTTQPQGKHGICVQDADSISSHVAADDE